MNTEQIPGLEALVHRARELTAQRDHFEKQRKACVSDIGALMKRHNVTSIPVDGKPVEFQVANRDSFDREAFIRYLMEHRVDVMLIREASAAATTTKPVESVYVSGHKAGKRG